MALPFVTMLVLPISAASAAALISQEIQQLSIFSNTYATTGANSSIFGSLLSGDVGTSGANGYISGNFTTVGAATIGGAGSRVGGDFTAGGALTTGDAAVVHGNITSGGAATVGANSAIGGSVAAAGAVSTGAASQVAGNINSGGAVSIGVGGAVSGTVGATGAITQAAGSTVPSSHPLLTPPVDAAALTANLSALVADSQSQLLAAQSAFSLMVTTNYLGATITTDTTLFGGVYSAPSLSTTAGTILTLDGQGKGDQFWVFNIANILSTGALSKIVLINGATGDSIIWNAGGYASLGADSLFLGTLIAAQHVSVGAGAIATGIGPSCGGLFSALSYISSGDGAKIGGAGCTGIDNRFDKDSDGKAYMRESSPGTAALPEPAVWMMWITGFGLIGTTWRRKPVRTVSA